MSLLPPLPRPLPLNSLRAFEAAARLGGFQQAADELCVTPGAVAQQVKTLETVLGARLFERHARGVRLTDLGRAVQPDIEAAFDALSQSSARLQRLAAPARVRIAALPAIAELYLAPRLTRLRAAVPGVELSVTAMEGPPNLAREPYDLTLFLTDDQAPGQWVGPPDTLFPVCAPHIADRIADLDDLMSLPHISDQSWADDWPRWLAATHPDRRYTGTGPSFSLYSMAVAEAVAGAGVLIGHSALLADHLNDGRLVTPLPGRLPSGRGMRLNRAGGDAMTPRMRAVVTALTQQN